MTELPELGGYFGEPPTEECQECGLIYYVHEPDPTCPDCGWDPR